MREEFWLRCSESRTHGEGLTNKREREGIMYLEVEVCRKDWSKTGIDMCLGP